MDRVRLGVRVHLGSRFGEGGAIMFVHFTIPKMDPEHSLHAVIDVCVARCVERWGGCTVTEGIGYWRSPAAVDPPDGFGLPIVEPVAILSVECLKDHGYNLQSERHRETFAHVVRAWFDNLATYVREKGNQHTVYYRMSEGEARFVGPNTIL